MTLREVICDEIRRSGPVPFSRYMELCLYHPQWGYYSRAAEQFGRGGDFYTSSDVHAVFGRLLARQFEEMWRMLGSSKRIDLIELGPGRIARQRASSTPIAGDTGRAPCSAKTARGRCGESRRK